MLGENTFFRCSGEKRSERRKAQGEEKTASTFLLLWNFFVFRSDVDELLSLIYDVSDFHEEIVTQKKCICFWSILRGYMCCDVLSGITISFSKENERKKKKQQQQKEGEKTKAKVHETGKGDENGGDFHALLFSAHILITTAYVEWDKENITKDLRSFIWEKSHWWWTYMHSSSYTKYLLDL